MCFLFKDVIEIRKKLLKNREKGILYVSTDCDPNVLEKETREKINQYLKERDEKRSGVIRGLGEGLARRGMSHAIFKRMGGPEVWARVSKGGVRREGGEGKKEEEGELKKGELCEFLSRVIRGRELGMSGKEKE